VIDHQDRDVRERLELLLRPARVASDDAVGGDRPEVLVDRHAVRAEVRLVALARRDQVAGEWREGIAAAHLLQLQRVALGVPAGPVVRVAPGRRVADAADLGAVEPPDELRVVVEGEVPDRGAFGHEPGHLPGLRVREVIGREPEVAEQRCLEDQRLGRPDVVTHLVEREEAVPLDRRIHHPAHHAVLLRVPQQQDREDVAARLDELHGRLVVQDERPR